MVRVMKLLNVVRWLKSATDCGAGCFAGTIDGDAEYCVGVYDGRAPNVRRVCIGGEGMAGYQAIGVRVLVHWGTSQPEAEEKAQEIASLLFPAPPSMDGIQVYLCDPVDTRPLGKDRRGICEYVLETKIYYKGA
jgi:hypothetical protein